MPLLQRQQSLLQPLDLLQRNQALQHHIAVFGKALLGGMQLFLGQSLHHPQPFTSERNCSLLFILFLFFFLNTNFSSWISLVFFFLFRFIF